MRTRNIPSEAGGQSKMDENPWAVWCKKKLVRDGEVLDRDVNYFVHKLEKFGARTLYSCGGHPDGFYVYFLAPYSLAVRIESYGYFNVEIEGTNGFSIRVRRPFFQTRTDKERTLAWAAHAWETNTRKPEYKGLKK